MDAGGIRGGGMNRVGADKGDGEGEEQHVLHGNDDTLWEGVRARRGEAPEQFLSQGDGGDGFAIGNAGAEAPEAEAAEEGVAVIAEARAVREALDAASIAAAEDDIIDDEGACKDRGDAIEGGLPFFLAEAVTTGAAEHVLEGALLVVGELAKLEGDKDVIQDGGGAETGAEAEEEHASTFIAAEGLHGGVVDELAGLWECGVVIELDPAASEIVRLAGGAVADDGDGEAEGDGVVVPVWRGELSEACD